MPKTLPEIVETYSEGDFTVTVYESAHVRRERQPLRKAGQRTSGRKTQAAKRLGVGSYKGVK